MTKNQKIFNGIDALVKTKDIDRNFIIEGLEEAMALACKKTYGLERVEVNINYETRRITMFAYKVVVDEVVDSRGEISLEEAQLAKKTAKIGEELKIRLKMEKDLLERAVVQSSKQVFKQKLKDAEYKKIVENYADKVDTVVTGYLEEIKDEYIYVSLEKNIIAVLPPKGQLTGEILKPDEPIKLVVEAIGAQSKKGPKIIVSRSSKVLVEDLFSEHIPEVANGDIEIKSISRIGGVRSKVAVALANPESDIDVIGSCVGTKGSRINSIKKEINGENIDLVEYFDEREMFIAMALAPALVTAVQILDEEERKARVIVPDDQFSLAIGLKAQNVKLATILTGWKIDIKTESDAEKDGIDYSEDLI